MTTIYRELVVKGNASILKGFLWGFKTAKRIKKGLIFCADYPIQTHHLKELLKGQGDHVHIVTSAKVHEAMVAAIKSSAESLAVEVVSDRRIKDARFEFRFETYSRDVAADLKRTLRRLPVSLELSGYEPKERIDPSAKGTELYSPVHDYEFAGKGKVRGDLEPLLRLHRKLKDHVFIEVDDIELVH